MSYLCRYNMVKRIFHIISKDFRVEFRQKHAIAGILLFAVTVVFIVFKSFNTFTSQEWALLLWILVLFSGINAVVKSFLQESKGTYLYYYTLLDPLEVVLSKLVYNFLLCFILFLVILGCMALFSGYPVRDNVLFFSSSILGLAGISIVYTMISALAVTGGHSGTLMSILALPLVLPVLLLLIKTTAVALGLLTDSTVGTDLLLLAGIDGVLISICLILFPIVWKS